MRRGVWVVLGLMGAVPGAALAQQAPRQPTEQTQGGSRGQQASDSSGAGADQQQVQGSGGVIEAAGTSDPALGTSGGLWGRDTSMTPAQAGTALPDDDTSGIALEIPRGGVAFPGVVGARRSQAIQAQSGVGGSGQNVRAPAAAAASTSNEEIFVGTVRSATRDRLLMQGPSRRVYEFQLGAKTRILGPNGAAMSLQSLREGMPVRTVTQPGDPESRVITLQVLEQSRAPSR